MLMASFEKIMLFPVATIWYLHIEYCEKLSYAP